MSKSETYTQCILRKGAQEHVAWIPTEFASVHSTLRDGWKVMATYVTKHKDYVLTKSRDYLNQREASDV